MKFWSRHKHLETRKVITTRSKVARNRNGVAQRNLVATHNSAKEEKARSQHGIVVATQIPGNKKLWSQHESSLLATKHGHDATIQVATAT